MAFGDESIYEYWEYLTEVIEADAKAQAEYLARLAPSVSFSKYAVQATMPRLNQLGSEGWELLQMQPVMIGTNADVLLTDVSGMSYTHKYLCVFKRRKRS